MRLITFRIRGGTRAGLVREHGAIIELPWVDVGEVLAQGEKWQDVVATVEGPVHRLEDLDLAPVVPKPSKIVCLGLNYRSHIAEMGQDLPTAPTLFAKYSEALIGARDPIVLPVESHEVDWEAELAFVIGRSVRRAGVAEAADAIAGFTVCNDISMRDWQRRTLQWLQGKTWEGTTPLGPALVTPDEVGGVSPSLSIRLEVDGEVLQDASTADLVFTPPDIVRYVSTIVTLKPGDVISTGTPAGVGDAREPKRFLRAGEVVRTSIVGLGELVNPLVRLAGDRRAARA